MHKRTDDTAYDRGKQDTRQASIHHACVCVHLQKPDQIWVVHWAPESFKLKNFLSD